MDYTTLLDDNKFIIGIIISIIGLFILGGTWFARKRVYYASIFGKNEHLFGRLLGLMLIGTFFIEYFKLGITLYAIIADFIAWFIYLASHTLEKAFYGHYGPRG